MASSQSADTQKAETKFDNNNDKNAYDVVIVGMGPVGLAAAYENAVRGKKVLILENRTEAEAAARPQIVVVNPQSKEQLLAMITSEDQLNENDLKFINDLDTSAEIKLSSVQSFIMNRIKNLKNQTGASIDMKYQTTLDEIDLDNGKANLVKADAHTQIKPVTFKNLIAADGARSPTYAKIHAAKNKTVKDQTLLSEKASKNQSAPDPRKTPNNMQHLEKKFHLGAYVVLKRKDGNKLDLPKRDFLSSFLKDKKSKKHHLYFLRFDKKSHQKSKYLSVKLSFIGEISHQTYDQIKLLNDQINELHKQLHKKRLELSTLQDDSLKTYVEEDIKHLETKIDKLKKAHDQIALTHVKEAAADYLTCSVDELEVEVKTSKNNVKNKLKILSFQGGSKKADEAAFVNANGIGFYLAGDAYFTPNYPVGHGLNDGLEAAQHLGIIPTNVSKKHQHARDYNKLTSGNAKHATSMMQAIRWTRKLGKIKYAMANLLEYGVVSINKEGGLKLDDKNTPLPDRIKDVIFYSASHQALRNPVYALEQALEKRKFNTDSNKYPTDDELITEIKKSIIDWDKFLSNIPSIIKEDIYRHEFVKYSNDIIEKLEIKMNKEDTAPETKIVIKGFIDDLKLIQTKYHISIPSDSLTKKAADDKNSKFRFKLPFFSQMKQTIATAELNITPDKQNTPKNK